MSWNGADLFVHGADLGFGGWSPSGRTGHFGAFPRSARVASGWLHVHSSAAAIHRFPRSPESLGAAGRVVAARYMGVVDAYTLDVVDAGSVTRRLVRSEGNLTTDIGEPLREEQPAAEFPEDWTFAVVARLTGIQVPDLVPTGGWHEIPA